MVAPCFKAVMDLLMLLEIRVFFCSVVVGAEASAPEAVMMAVGRPCSCDATRTAGMCGWLLAIDVVSLQICAGSFFFFFT